MFDLRFIILKLSFIDVSHLIEHRFTITGILSCLLLELHLVRNWRTLINSEIAVILILMELYLISIEKLVT